MAVFVEPPAHRVLISKRDGTEKSRGRMGTDGERHGWVAVLDRGVDSTNVRVELLCADCICQQIQTTEPPGTTVDSQTSVLHWGSVLL